MTEVNFDLLDKIDVGIIILDQEQEIVFWNEQLEEMTKKTMEELKGKKIGEINSLFETEMYQGFFNSVLTKKQSFFNSGALHQTFIPTEKETKQNLQMEPITIDDNPHILLQIFDITSQEKRIKNLRQEINNRIKAEEKLKKLKTEYEVIFNNAMEGICLIDVESESEFKFLRVNPIYEELIGLSLPEIRGKTPVEVLGEKLGSLIKEKYKRCVEEQNFISYQEELELPSGTKILQTKLSPVFIDGKVEQIVGTSFDITKREKEREKIKYLSFHDQMTGLYNRRYFENELERLNNSRQLPITIAIADINNLKEINDKFGHSAGDDYIKRAADLLTAVTREEDVVARIGGDEFGVILPNTGEETAKSFVGRIYNQCEDKDICDFDPAKNNAYIAVGTATMETNQGNIDEIFNRADQNMYQEKKKLKNS